MMNLSYFRGCMVGLAAAAPSVGLSILCVRRTLAEGWLCGVTSGLGIATVDAFYSAIASSGADLVAHLLEHYHHWLRGFAGLLLCIVGCRIALMPAIQLASVHNTKLLNRYGSMLALTLADPVPIFLSIVILAGIKPTTYPFHVGMLSLGVFSGSMLWWLGLCSTCELLRSRLKNYSARVGRSPFHPTVLKWLNRFAGATLFGCGLMVISSLRP
ncbi:LysE family transporter [Leptolyngbya sp. FACHB-671]|uniref:LysE family translocator n=1 Tax=Leptolyngbya sp. FACHB-671 TaxID=2692812 RepID=UPI00168495D6|nr:LysE family transporter [Leptolyngbya sp. FACHB-671]MBD2069521.1 LysE family transporter [Leptolyngbya sp. FACHB-671]